MHLGRKELVDINHIIIFTCYSHMPQLGYVVKGVKSRTTDRLSCPQVPITIRILSSLMGVWQKEPDVFNASILWVAACMCFFWSLASW